MSLGRKWKRIRSYWILISLTMVAKCQGLEHDNSGGMDSNDNICGGVIVNRRKGVIESPNYPIRYPERARCDWLIRAPNVNDVIELRFIDIQIETSTLCLFDYIEISHILGTSPKRFCSPASEIVRSRGNFVHVRFVSDSTDSRAGFRIAFRVLKATSTSYQTTVSIPTTPQSYHKDTSTALQITSDVPTTQSTKAVTSPRATTSLPRDSTTIEIVYSTTVPQRISDITTNQNRFEIQENNGVGDYLSSDASPSVDSGESLKSWQIVLITVTATSCVAFVSFVAFIYVGLRKSTSYHRGCLPHANDFS
uniref:CUB domain-containing protein 2-like n=1 Tax=Ciona intestinalis TaxID=7719 RepID=UPI00089DBF41|nr:CUB domain-containing protein 2-like [Ciona intestinalis]|eukprot:XP_004225866.2 CUB domain-containing protein 2-like [Ciona intestinalis]